jgi:DNA-binding MarR family transcriptional regulator
MEERARKSNRPSPDADAMVGLDDRPGFLIRRAHQISQSVFIDECQSLDITATQFGVMSVLARFRELDQIGIARALGFDRSTTALVVKLLEDRALIVRTSNAADRRRHVLRLTAAGEKLRRRAEPLVDRVRDRLVGAFPPGQAATFMALLDKFIRSFDHIARVPPRRLPK